MVAKAEQRKWSRERHKIWTPKSEAEELAKAFRQETELMLKKIALENNCDVEELKYTVNNMGIVNVQRMTEEEMAEAEKQRKIALRKKEIRKIKGLD